MLTALVTISLRYWPSNPTLAPIWYLALFLPKFWTWMLLVGALPALLRRGWSVRIFCLGIIALQLFNFHGLRLNLFPNATINRPVLKMATYNGDDRFLPAEAFKNWIGTESLDLVLLQATTHKESALEAFPSDWTILHDNELAVATRLPIETKRRLSRSKLTGGYGMIYTHLVLQWDGRTLNLFNIHLITPRDALERLRYLDFNPEAIRKNYRQKEYEARELAAAIPFDRPFILAGDFNMLQESPLYRRYFGAFPNAFNETGLGWGHTMMTSWHGIRIDHVVTSKHLRPIFAQTGPDFGSSHLPLITSLSFGSLPRDL